MQAKIAEKQCWWFFFFLSPEGKQELNMQVEAFDTAAAHLKTSGQKLKISLTHIPKLVRVVLA